jgi:hypothetical protein
MYSFVFLKNSIGIIRNSRRVAIPGDAFTHGTMSTFHFSPVAIVAIWIKCISKSGSSLTRSLRFNLKNIGHLGYEPIFLAFKTVKLK